MSFKGEDLFEEKNLWSIYRVCFSRLRRSKFNSYSTLTIFTLLLLSSLFSKTDGVKLAEIVRNLADLGLGYGTTILGFLIAGFTIFATLTKPQLLRRMYEETHESGLNYIKVNFFAFIEVFIVYLTFITTCLLINIFFGENGPATSFISRINTSSFFDYSLDVSLLKKIGFVSFCTLAYYAIVTLKSFVYNTHHAVMTLVVWTLNEEAADSPGN